MIESSADSSPLHLRRDNNPFAVISAPVPSLKSQPSIISPGRFYNHVLSVAEKLPDRPFGINLCENRYLFCVAFCAVLVKRQTNLLPPNRAPKTLTALEQKHDCYYLIDGNAPTTSAQTIDLGCLALADSDTPADMVNIPSDHLAAICYTSGSTGESKPIYKTWGLICRGSTINGRMMTEGLCLPAFQLATVPPQHMWGLETSVLLPLQQQIVMSDSRPLYPADIVALLESLPGPKLLVSTPIHLRALMRHSGPIPPLERVLCATSPLEQPLAGEIEQRTGGVLLEIYGCSEMGSMAARRTSTTEIWTLFPGFSFTRNQKGRVTAHADHIEQPTELGDFLQLIDNRHFRLSGRADDLINIGGKRGSLAEINKVLLQFDGIEDGVVFQPDPSRPLSRLAALVVFREGAQKSALLEHFRDCIDPAFIPRPILSVSSLPRSENGKLPRKSVLALYQSQRQRV